MTESSSALRFFTCDPTYRRFDACSLWNTGLQHNQSTCLAERGHSCPQQLPNASVGRFVARSPQSPSLRTGMSALRAKRVTPLQRGYSELAERGNRFNPDASGLKRGVDEKARGHGTRALLSALTTL